MKTKKFKVKQRKNYFWFIILGAFLVVFCIFIAPFWAKIKNADIPWENWGITLFLFFLAITLFVYIFKVLVYKLKVKQQHKIVKILTTVEFSLMVFISVICILFGLNGIDVIEFNIPSSLNNHLGAIIVGFAMWVRGFVEIFGAYLYDKNNASLKKYPVWYLLVNICLISCGPILTFNKDITDEILLYIYASLFFIFGVFLIVLGCLSKPSKITETPATNGKIEKEPHNENKLIENKNDDSNNEIIEIEDNNN